MGDSTIYSFRTIKCFSFPPIPHHHATNGYLPKFLLLTSGFQQKLQGILKGKIHSLKKQQASEPDSNMTERLGLLYLEFKTTVINMLRTNGKSGQHAKQMSNINREKEILRKIQKGIVEISNKNEECLW